MYLETGSASIFFSLDGTFADWRASIGRRTEKQISDREYSRLRATIPVTETIDDDGKMLIVRNARGDKESWIRPAWTLAHIERKQDESIHEKS